MKVKWILKGCPRCGGDMFGEFSGFTCLQCGHHLEVKHANKRTKSLSVGIA